jgi:hypothetical protein
MDQKEFDALVEKVGGETAKLIKTALQPYEAQVLKLAQEVAANKGGITEETFTAFKTASKQSLEAVKAICEKQGVTLGELSTTLGNGKQATKSISQVFEEDREILRGINDSGQGVKTYMVTLTKEGSPVMRPISLTNTKAAGAEATVAGVGSGNVSAIVQALDAATLIRIGGNAQIFGQYRNSSWIFDLCNTINASFNSQMPFVLWFDELPKVGSSAEVAEGTAKPMTQYLYKLQSSTYRKEATLVGMTDEFQMDFAQLESDIMNKARIDVINRVNTAILPRLKAAATPYNTELSFRGGTGSASYIPNVNGFDAIAAMAAQVDNATFGARANAAVMSTFKKYRLGITKNTQGTYLNPPAVLDGIGFVGNPAMGADDLLVGDFKQYNIILRGGLIVKVGFNGNDFANNMFSVVLEQYYFDYISNIRKVAIVSGPTFQNVENVLTDDQGSI